MPKRKAPSVKSNKAAKMSKEPEKEADDEDEKEEEEEEEEEEVTAVKGKATQVAAAAAAREHNLHICSWNINGVRAWAKKKGHDFLKAEKPDALVVQETKCGEADLPPEVKHVSGYHTYWQSTDNRKGYAGVGLISKTKPLKVTFGMGIEKHDSEGRLVTAEYDKYYLIGSYVPNSGRGLVRLGYRQEWDGDLRDYLARLDKNKPVVFCGDLNVAHQEIDLANPATNRNKTAGFTDEERQGFDQLLGAGFVDAYRSLYPDKRNAYTFWSYMGNARAKNVGWRLDYFVLSERLRDAVCDSVIHSDVEGSDHCPISLLLDLP